MSHSTKTIQVKKISSFSSQGSRPLQEDAVLQEEDKKIFIVADGFGGSQAGIKASQTACESIKSFLFKEAGDLDATLPFILRSYFSLAGNVLFNALIFANRKLIRLNDEKNIHEKGGASVLAALIDDQLLVMANVGVCTAWLFRSGQAIELVVPRSYGRLTDPYLKTIPDELQFPLIALGMAQDLEPEIVEYRIKQGDWIFLQTDGIIRGIDSEISKIQLSQLSEDESTQQVTALLKSKSYQDNACAILVIL